MVVSNKTLERADAYRFTLDAANAFAFTLLFLRAYTSANGREEVCGGDDLICFFKFACGNLGNKFGNTYADRATLTAKRIFAVEASCRFFHCLLGRIAKANFFKISGADFGVLLRYGCFFGVHISHDGVLL